MHSCELQWQQRRRRQRAASGTIISYLNLDSGDGTIVALVKREQLNSIHAWQNAKLYIVKPLKTQLNSSLFSVVAFSSSFSSYHIILHTTESEMLCLRCSERYKRADTTMHTVHTVPLLSYACRIFARNGRTKLRVNVNCLLLLFHTGRVRAGVPTNAYTAMHTWQPNNIWQKN